jgi:hypothetical protein
MLNIHSQARRNRRPSFTKAGIDHHTGLGLAEAAASDLQIMIQTMSMHPRHPSMLLTTWQHYAEPNEERADRQC